MDKVEVTRLAHELPRLLEQVAGGESIMLVQQGREVAILAPVVARPDLDPTDHTPDANHISPLMRKIMRKRNE